MDPLRKSEGNLPAGRRPTVSQRRAFTLVELLVGSLVFILITGVIGVVFITAHRYTRLYQQVSLAQREALHCLQQVSRELLRGRAESLNPDPAVNATWFLSSQPPLGTSQAAEFNPHGVLLWQKWVGIWCSSTGEVRCSEQALSPPLPWLEIAPTSHPGDISPFQSGAHRRLASYISSLRLWRDQKLVTVEVISQTQQFGNAPTRFHFNSSFLMQ